MYSTMRELMQMVETLERPREGPPVPDTLYYGTSYSNWESIQESGSIVSIEDHEEPAVSFTTDWNTASRQAREAADASGDMKGVILSFNGDSMARKYNITPFADSAIIHAEQSWHVPGDSVDQVMRYLVGTEEVSV